MADAEQEEEALVQELQVLESIYLDELLISREETYALSITLHPATADDADSQYVRLTLQLSLPPQYPAGVPEIKIKNPRGLCDEQINSITSTLQSLATHSLGSPVLYELIEKAKELLTASNIPKGHCVICLYEFQEGDCLTKTQCFHHFHSHCLGRYAAHSREQDLAVLCPVCRENLSCDLRKLQAAAPPQHPEEMYIPDAHRLQQQKELLQIYERQLAKGGIIDVEAERNRFFISIQEPPAREEEGPVPLIGEDPMPQPTVDPKPLVREDSVLWKDEIDEVPVSGTESGHLLPNPKGSARGGKRSCFRPFHKSRPFHSNHPEIEEGKFQNKSKSETDQGFYNSHRVYNETDHAPNPSHRVSIETPRAPNTSHRGYNQTHRAPNTSHRGYNETPLAPNTFHRGYNETPRAPNTSHRGYNQTHRAPNTSHRGYNETPLAPNTFHRGYNETPRAPNTSHRGYNETPRAPNTSHSGYNETPRAPNTSHRGYNETHRAPNTSHRGYNETPRAPNTSHRGYNETARAPNTSHRGYNETHRAPNTSHIVSNQTHSAPNTPPKVHETDSANHTSHRASNETDHAPNSLHRVHNETDSADHTSHRVSNETDHAPNSLHRVHNETDSADHTSHRVSETNHSYYNHRRVYNETDRASYNSRRVYYKTEQAESKPVLNGGRGASRYRDHRPCRGIRPVPRGGRETFNSEKSC
ncbi:E3 ubiquitin-protein ligase RNF25 [Discoglossus pictus]